MTEHRRGRLDDITCLLVDTYTSTPAIPIALASHLQTVLPFMAADSIIATGAYHVGVLEKLVPSLE